MMQIKTVSKLTGVSIRTLQYYDSIGLLKPSGYTHSGYRMYDETALEKLQQILLFKELEFPLKEIREIIDAPDFDKTKALEQQIELLTMKKEHLENIISFAQKIKNSGGVNMDFSVFDTKKIEEYSEQAKIKWGNTSAYKEYEEKTKNKSGKTMPDVQKFMKLFAEFGELKSLDPADMTVQLQVKKLQNYITENFYNCTEQILCSLGQMYSSDGEFKENIDKAGGEGTAEFTSKAIEYYCAK